MYPLESYRKRLRLSRLVGRCSAFCFLLTALCIADALQMLVRHDYNHIDIIAGETLRVTGNMPANTRSVTDLTARVDGPEGVTFQMLETFSGFWLGGAMWRGELHIPPHSPNTTAHLVIEDLWPGEDGAPATQNPTLVYPVTIWENLAQQQAASNSLLVRHTGVHPFFAAVLCGVSALLLGSLQWFLFRQTCAILSQAGFYPIHGIRKEIQGTTALFVPPRPAPTILNAPVLLFSPQLQPCGTGTITVLEPHAGAAFFDQTGQAPRYGWFIQPTPKEQA